MDLNSYTNCFPTLGSGHKTTCRQCRLRKVRCDGEEDGCGNCQRLNFSCSLSASSHLDADEDSTEELVVQLRPKRRRGSRACVGCRKQKVRCSGSLPQCTTCERRGVPCLYPTLKRQITVGSGNGGPNTIGVFPAGTRHIVSNGLEARLSSERNDDEGDPPTEVDFSVTNQHIPQLVGRFFTRLHPLPCYSFLHPATIKDRTREGRLEKCLAFAICGVVALHSSPDQRTRHESSTIWIQMAEQLVWKHIECPTILRLQALLLVINYRMETGRFQKAFMFASLAARAAVALRLNHERENVDSVAAEGRRRIMWSLKLVDRYFSIGLAEFELCPFETIYLKLPCREGAFGPATAPPDTQNGVGSSATPEAEEAMDDGGSLTVFIRLEVVRRDIMKLTRYIAVCDQPFPQLPKLLRDIIQDTAKIGDEMPLSSTLTPARLSSLLSSPWLPRYVAMHLSYHQCFCDLYRLMLAGYQEAAPQVVLAGVDEALKRDARRYCLDHAQAIIEILASLNQLSTTPHLLEYDTAICAYHAMRLVLFISRVGAQNTDLGTRLTPEVATSQAELCLAALRRFYPSSALVNPIIDEMERSIAAFSAQHNCGVPAPRRLQSFSSESHRADAMVAPGAGDTTPTPQQSWAERTREKLAIHSLLRQAEFSEGEAEEGELIESMTSPHSSAAVAAASLSAMSAGALAASPDHSADSRSSGTSGSTAVLTPNVGGGSPSGADHRSLVGVAASVLLTPAPVVRRKNLDDADGGELGVQGLPRNFQHQHQRHQQQQRQQQQQQLVQHQHSSSAALTAALQSAQELASVQGITGGVRLGEGSRLGTYLEGRTDEPQFPLFPWFGGQEED